jgi:hypothetical protein
VRIDGTGRWVVEGLGKREPREMRLTYDAVLRGKATYDRAANRVTAFELLAVGPRSGATRYNVRHDDLGPAPMGVLFTLADDSPSEHVAPAHFWSYGW